MSKALLSLVIFTFIQIYRPPWVDALPSKRQVSGPGVSNKPAQKIYSNMILYEQDDKDFPMIQYKNKSNTWHSRILFEDKHGRPKYKRMCAIGTWLIYKRGVCRADKLEDVTLFTSNTLKCVPISKIGRIHSAQTITHAGIILDDTIAYFKTNKFDNIATEMNLNKGQVARALTTVGKKTWTLKLRDWTTIPPQKYCIIPPQDFDGVPVCFLSSFADGTTLKDVEVFTEEGCKDDVPEWARIKMEQCYDSNAGMVRPLKESIPIIKPPKVTTKPPIVIGDNNTITEPPLIVETPEPPTGPSDCTVNTKDVLSEDFKVLFRARLSGALFSGNWMQPVRDPQNLWRLELFDLCVEVLRHMCLSLNPEYITLFEAVYTHLLDKSWEEMKPFSKLPFIPASFGYEDHREIISDMQRCLGRLGSTDIGQVNSLVEEELATYKNFDVDVAKKVQEFLGFRPKLDYVMELNWFLANLVASSCYTALGYDANFLPRFLNIFHELYFIPVQKKWQSKKYNEAYFQLFAGYGVKRQMSIMGVCTYHSVKLSNIPVFYKRPFEQRDQIFLPQQPGIGPQSGLVGVGEDVALTGKGGAVEEGVVPEGGTNDIGAGDDAAAEAGGGGNEAEAVTETEPAAETK